jgi:hypothetical protein
VSERDTPESILFGVILPLTRIWHQVPAHDVAALRERIMRIYPEYGRQDIDRERVHAILQQIKAGIDAANTNGIVCGYPETVEIDGERYDFERALTSFGPRVITRTMTDGIRTKDSAA